MKTVNVKPLLDRVIVFPKPVEEKANGIIIPKTSITRPLCGTIVAVGNGTKDEEIILKIGDEVLYEKYSGTEIEFEGKKFLIMSQRDIMAVLE